MSASVRTAPRTRGSARRWADGRIGTVELDADKLRTALDCKGVTARELAHASRVAEYTVGRALRGLPLTRRKAAAIVRSLVEMPDVKGMADFVRWV